MPRYRQRRFDGASVWCTGFDQPHEAMIVQFASVIVPQPQASEYLEYLETSAIPTYESAPGLISVYLLQRSFVAYTEVL